MSPDDREPEPPPFAAEARDLLQGLLRRTHLTIPSDVAAVIAEEATAIGASDVALYLADYEQRDLIPMPGSAGGVLSPLSIIGTVAGRAFSTTTILKVPAEQPGAYRLWLPLLDGTERFGTIGMSFPSERLTDALIETCERYAHLIAMVIATKADYGDAFEIIRRRRPMTIASELLWSLAPPLVFATDDLVLAGLLEPAYDNGGDALDYAVDQRVLRLGVFDAMGHGLAAAGVAAFAVSAYRHSRRRGCGLEDTYSAMDEAVGQQFPDSRFVTAVIAELDLDTGRLTWVSAGHPPPLLIRDGRHARTLDATPVPPLGVEFHRSVPRVADESLEPGDLVLFYTDGLIEARGPDDAMLTLEGVSQFIEREAASDQTAPEMLRRIRHAIIGRETTELRDDATALLLEWRRGGELRVLPQTVA